MGQEKAGAADGEVLEPTDQLPLVRHGTGRDPDGNTRGAARGVTGPEVRRAET